MTPAAKNTYSLALVIGLFVGVFYGFSITGSNLQLYYSSMRLTAPRVFEDYSVMQYRHADFEHATTALLTFADFLEKLEASNPEDQYRLNLATTYTRLAILEDAANNAAASRDYMTKTRYWYPASGDRRHNYSDSEIKAAVKTGDERLQSLGIP